MNEGLQILKQGVMVKTIVGNIECMVTGVSIRGENIRYELTYFKNMDYTTIWLERFEFEVQPLKQQAGFNYEPNVKLLKSNPPPKERIR